MAILDLLDGTGTTPDIRAVSLDAIATDSLVAVSFERELAASTEALLTVRKGPARAISTQVSAVLHFLAAHCDTVLVVAGESEALRLMTEQPEVFVRCVHALHGNARPPPAPRNAGDMLERRALIRDEPPPLRVRGVRRLDEKYGMRVYSAQTNASSMRDLAALARDLAGTRIGIALGAGSARGFAHIGVLERLRELGVPIDALVGSSVGSGIGGLWSFGIEADRVEHLIAGLQTQGMGWALPTRSLLNGNKLERHIRYGADGHGFDDTLWPFGIVAVDLYAAQETLLTDGDLPKCVLASCAIPGIYPPVRIGGRWYVDGSVLHPVPTSFVRSLGVDRVIAVDLGGSQVPASPTRFGPFLLEVLGRSAALMHARITEHSRLGADIVLRPQSVGETPGVRDYMKSRHRWRALGREAVDAAYDELVRLMPPAWQRAPSAAGDVRGRGAL